MKVTILSALLATLLSTCGATQPMGDTAVAVQRLEYPDYADTEHIVEYSGFTVSYNHTTLVPDWVAYELTADELVVRYSSKSSNFSRDLSLSRHAAAMNPSNRDAVASPQVLIAANAVNGTKGGIGSSYLSQIVTSHFSPDVETLQSKVSTLFLYNKHLNYKVFMIPALLAIVMMLMCGFLPALNIVGEKETGTIEQINVTPVSKWAFILAKLIPYWLIALFIISVCLLLAWAVYGITCQGPLWLVYVLAMLLALFFSSFGLLISNYSDTLQQAIFVMWFFVVCLMLLSGLFTPTRSMPDWSYLTTYVNPMHYFIDAIRTVFVRGGGFASVAHQVLALLGFASVMGTWAVASYKKNS